MYKVQIPPPPPTIKEKKPLKNTWKKIVMCFQIVLTNLHPYQSL